MSNLEYLRENIKLEELDAKEIFTQIVEGIAYSHKKNVIHRDIKLENIVFLDEERTIIKVYIF